MKIIKFNPSKITVDGIDGYFSQTQLVGAVAHIHHVILNDDGIGCQTRNFVGSVPNGSYDEGSNPEYENQVVSKIEKYIENSLGENLHGNTGNKNASGELPANTQLQIRLNTTVKSRYVNQAQADGLKLSQWVIRTLDSAIKI